MHQTMGSLPPLLPLLSSEQRVGGGNEGGALCKCETLNLYCFLLVLCVMLSAPQAARDHPHHHADVLHCRSY